MFILFKIANVASTFITIDEAVSYVLEDPGSDMTILAQKVSRQSLLMMTNL